jgi:hypothetical protein
MKILILALLLVTALTGAPMTASERQHLVAHLEMTESWLADEVSGLSLAQLNFRFAPGHWTILDVVEHLTLAEPEYWAWLQADLKKPPAPMNHKVTDLDLLWYGIDRTDRQMTSPSEEPKGKLADVEQGLVKFRKLRATIMKYARTSNDDLRGHAFPDWGVDIDSYTALLGISTHSQRHILQIREIKAQPGYPKK